VAAELTHPRIALILSHFAPDEIHRMVEAARYAESCGIDDLTLVEHVVSSVDQRANPSQGHSYDDVLPEPMVTLGPLLQPHNVFASSQPS
jgi:hypothetical protein